MGYSVTLEEMLDARERRAFRQQRLLSRYHRPLICFTMNIAGPVKTSAPIRRGFELGKKDLESQLSARGITSLYQEELHEHTGSEAYYVLDADPLFIKKITAHIEDQTPAGRLFDMDVLTPEGEKLERCALGLSPRRCLICGRPAKECARSRRHSVPELQEKTAQILEETAAAETNIAADAKDAAVLACRALLYEVCTTPKPGLVDRANSGSHRDMDIFTFMDSSSALWPYFEACVSIGRETMNLAPGETFLRLRQAGVKAESRMYAATNGVNTHKGAIFSMGILCGALGRLPREKWADSTRLLDECAQMTHDLSAADFAGLTAETAHTVGQRLYLKYGITGVRGQVEAGFPAVREAGLPVLMEGLARDLSLNDAGCAALLAIMANSVDTNLIARGSLAIQQETAARLKTLLQENPYPDKEKLEQLDREFIEKNLSPGGSADLLAICYFLYFLQKEAH